MNCFIVKEKYIIEAYNIELFIKKIKILNIIKINDCKYVVIILGF